jgi:uncharacterized protein
MKFRDEFAVALPAPDAWTLLTDLGRIGPCIPGAHLGAIVDGEYRGRVTTQIGPASVSYRGIARFAERDDVGHRAVIELRGRDERGSGAVRAMITAELAETDHGTRVRVSTDLFLSGTAAQFGRAQLAEFGTALVAEFAARLDAAIRGSQEPEPASAAESHRAPVPSGPVRAAPGGTCPDPGTLARHAPMLRKLALPAAAALAAGLLGWLAGRRGPRRWPARLAGRPPHRR